MNKPRKKRIIKELLRILEDGATAAAIILLCWFLFKRGEWGIVEASDEFIKYWPIRVLGRYIYIYWKEIIIKSNE